MRFPSRELEERMTKDNFAKARKSLEARTIELLRVGVSVKWIAIYLGRPQEVIKRIARRWKRNRFVLHTSKTAGTE